MKKVLSLLLLMGAVVSGRAVGFLSIHVVNNTGTNIYWKVTIVDPDTGTHGWTPTGSGPQATGTTVDASTANSSSWDYPAQAYAHLREPTPWTAAYRADPLAGFTIADYNTSIDVTYTFGPITYSGSYCWTNSSSAPAYVQVINQTDNSVAMQQYAAPLSVICWEASYPFRFEIVEIITGGTIDEPTIQTKTNTLWTYTAEADETAAGDSTQLPKANPGNTNPGVASDATSQEVGAAIVNQLQDSQKANDIGLDAINKTLKEIRDKVATNRTDAGESDVGDGVASMQDTLDEVKGDVEGAMGTVSNTVNGAFTGGIGEGADAGSGLSFDIPNLVPHSSADTTFSFFDNPNIDGLRLFARKCFLWIIKVLAYVFLYKQMMVCMGRMAEVLKGNGTSGFLQAALVSVPNLVSSLAGLGIRWGAFVVAMPTLAIGFGGYLTTISSEVGVSDFSGLVPSNALLAAAWNLFLYCVPVDEAFRVMGTAVTGSMAMHTTVLVASVTTDATSKV